MIKIGITGSIASGKTTASKILSYKRGPLFSADKAVKELERATTKVSSEFKKDHGHDPVTFMLTQVGGNSGRPLAGSENKNPDLLGSITVELIDADLRNYSSFAFVGALQEEVKRHPVLETLSFRGWRSGPGGDGLEVSILGADAQTLKTAAEWLITQLAAFRDVSGLEDNQAYDKNELILELTARGESLGFTVEGIGAELYARLNGVEAIAFPEGGRTAKIIVSLSLFQKQELEKVTYMMFYYSN